MEKFFQDIRSDLRYAARSLSRSPGFTAAAIVTIALGIGVNAGVFTVLNGVLFRDLPAPAAHELVSISQTVEGVPDDAISRAGTFSTAEYRAYRDRAQTLSGLLAYSNVSRETTLGGDAPQEIYGALVSSAEALLSRNESRYENDKFRWLYLIGRRSERAGADQVRAELGVIAAQIDRQQPGRLTTLTIERAKPVTVPPDRRGAATGAAAVLMARSDSSC